MFSTVVKSVNESRDGTPAWVEWVEWGVWLSWQLNPKDPRRHGPMSHILLPQHNATARPLRTHCCTYQRHCARVRADDSGAGQNPANGKWTSVMHASSKLHAGPAHGKAGGVFVWVANAYLCNSYEAQHTCMRGGTEGSRCCRGHVRIGRFPRTSRGTKPWLVMRRLEFRTKAPVLDLVYMCTCPASGTARAATGWPARYRCTDTRPRVTCPAFGEPKTTARRRRERTDAQRVGGNTLLLSPLFSIPLPCMYVCTHVCAQSYIHGRPWSSIPETRHPSFINAGMPWLNPVGCCATYQAAGNARPL